MTLLRALLIVLFVVFLAYTLRVIATDGWGFADVFLTDLVAMGWAGQFNLDFGTYLILSAVWIAWRHRFAPGGVVLALIAAVGGALFFLPYVFILTLQAKGDPIRVAIGDRSIPSRVEP